jgi:hypothetical protein
MIRRAVLAITLLISAWVPAAAQKSEQLDPFPGVGKHDVPFVPGGTYAPDIKSPDEFLGRTLGSWPASHDEIVGYFEYLSDTCPNASLHEYGKTYEGRRLIYLVVTSKENAGRLDDIRQGIAKLADPRGVKQGDAERIIERSPAVAWVAYSIHGDELSGCDAALYLAYQLLAGTDADSRTIQNELVVCIDPCENPDGRTRWLTQMQQWRGVVTSTDVQSFAHRGSWPYGRGNHYLFDLNRDWFTLVHPESRARTAAVLDWMPQYMLDAHEMGATNTFMFSPPREPFNPYMVSYIHKWWRRAAENQARAFDRHGWSYYTREWNEEFYPGYGSSWGIYLGAVGMLFEQAGVDASQVKRPEGTIMPYRETVHHQFVGSMSNLLTVASGRKELLKDYYEQKRRNVQGDGRSEQVFLFPPGPNRSRLARFADDLRHQHIEVEIATAAFKVARAVSSRGEEVRDRSFPAGTVIVPTAQPLRQLVETLLSFDIRMPTSFLETEKKESLKHGRTRVYETTAWSLPLAYDLEAYQTASLSRTKTEPYQTPTMTGGLTGTDSPVGFVFDCADDRAYQLLVRLLDRSYQVWAARKPFENAGKLFPRGSFQIRLNGNPGMDLKELDRLARETGVDVMGIVTSLGKTHADLGGEEFVLLETPRIAIVGGSPLSASDFGAIWHLLDYRFGLRASLLDISALRTGDLDTYNVLVLPDSWGGPDAYRDQLGKSGVSRLKEWVSDGGTLVAIGGAAAFAADTSVALGSTRLLPQVLKDLDSYTHAREAARESESPSVDSLDVWEGKKESSPAQVDEKTKPSLEAMQADDETARKLQPRGAILSVDLDDEHWLNFGCGSNVPVIFYESFAYVAKSGVEVPGRFSEPARLRLSGLLWPEARARWAHTAYLTREAIGKGQVILFAATPDFRGCFYGSERLLLNAMFLGPGFGTRRPIEW